MKRILLDTPVLIRGLIDPLSAASRLVRMAIDGAVQICVTDALLSDYRCALGHPVFGIDPNQANTLLSFLDAAGRCPAPASVLTGDIFRAAALSIDVDCWVVSEAALRRSPMPENVLAITARDFIDQTPPPQDVAARSGPAILPEMSEHHRP